MGKHKRNRGGRNPPARARPTADNNKHAASDNKMPNFDNANISGMLSGLPFGLMSGTVGGLTLDSFSNPLARIGADTVNMLEATEYVRRNYTADYMRLNNLYRQNWVVKRLVDVVPEDMTKNWYRIVSQLSPDAKKQITRLERQTRIRSKVLEGLKWGRLYGGAAAVIIIEGHDEILGEPLDLDMITPGSFKGLVVLDRWCGISPSLGLVRDISDPDFGMPEYYDITASALGQSVKVHHSRIVRFIGRPLPHIELVMEQYWGSSEIEHILEELKKYDNTSHNIAALVFSANLKVYKMEGFDQFATMPTEVQRDLYNTLAMMNWMMCNQGMQIIGATDNFETHQYSFGGLSEIYEMFMLDVSGASEIPVTKLFGRSPAGMNATGESDMQNYYDGIEEKQETYLRPVIDKLLPIQCMSEFGAVPDDLDFEFNPCRRPTEEQKKNILQNTAGAVVDTYNAGIINQKIALTELRESSEATGMWNSIGDEDIDSADTAFRPEGEMLPPEYPDMDLSALSLDGLPAADAERHKVRGGNPDNRGQFSKGAGNATGGESAGSAGESEGMSQDVAQLMGIEHKGVKGQQAIDRLLQERQGHVKGAFRRDGVGEIDLLWGDETLGLQKIINRREFEGFDGESFLSEIPNVIRNGKIRKQSNGRFLISLGNQRAIISPELRGEKITFLLTAYERY